MDDFLTSCKQQAVVFHGLPDNNFSTEFNSLRTCQSEEEKESGHWCSEGQLVVGEMKGIQWLNLSNSKKKQKPSQNYLIWTRGFFVPRYESYDGKQARAFLERALYSFRAMNFLQHSNTSARAGHSIFHEQMKPLSPFSRNSWFIFCWRDASKCIAVRLRCRKVLQTQAWWGHVGIF